MKQLKCFFFASHLGITICSLRVSYTYRTFSLSWISHSSLYAVSYLSWKRSNDVPCICCLFFFFSKQTKMLMGEVMREAAFSLAEAKFTAGDFRWGLLILWMSYPWERAVLEFSFGKKVKFSNALRKEKNQTVDKVGQDELNYIR